MARLTATLSNEGDATFANIIDGRKLAAEKLEQVKIKIEERLEKGLSRPGLATVLIGHDPASQIYVKNKRRTCQKIGIETFEHNLPSSISEEELFALIDALNHDSTVHGILVQLPLPTHINEQNILERINPAKDVDGFHPYNLGRLAQRHPCLRPCTPYGITQLLESLNIKLAGKHAVIIGASNIVGRPMALELLLKACTVTVCHRQTQRMPELAKQADILIAAAGQPNLVPAAWIKPGAIVIDVGINRLDDGSLTGDVNFEEAKNIASHITPVPGGVGPMTIATLMQNTLQACELTLS